MNASSTFRLAAIQSASVCFDPDASTEKACRLISEAAGKGADLVAFGETWLTSYPFFVTSEPSELSWEAGGLYLASAIEIPGPETERICQAAKSADVDVAIGVAERDPHSHGTVYCTLLFVAREGYILGRHRKLKPTFGERKMWGDGDAIGLTVYDRPYGRLSGLNCWEHKMMLPGYTLIAGGTQIHVATWPYGERRTPKGYLWSKQHLLSRAFAAQAAAYVICVGTLRLASDVPTRFRELLHAESNGDSIIIDPRGEIVAGPLEGEGILVADGSMDVIRAAKVVCDIGGHYARPDIFELSVNATPRRPVRVINDFADDGQAEYHIDQLDGEPRNTI